MAARKKAIDKLQELIGGEAGSLGDGSGSWVRLENNDYSIDFSFSGDGKTFEKIMVAKKIWQVVDEKVFITLPK
jgi:hypothetical protein